MKVALFLLLVFAALCWRFPMVRWVPIGQTGAEEKEAAFNSPQTAADFWNNKLLPAAENSMELGDLLKELARNDGGTRKEHGQTLGIGGATMFLTHGSGRIVELDEDKLVVIADGTNTRVELAVGLLFGNTVRDASGLLDVSDYEDSQSFNELSSDLNQIVESRVIPELKETAAVGKTLRFSGCFELEEGAKTDSINVIPLKIAWP